MADHKFRSATADAVAIDFILYEGHNSGRAPTLGSP